jgi:hypothetical protein
VQTGRRVVGAPEDVEHLHQVVGRLVRRDLPHVQQVGPAFVVLAALQPLGQTPIGRVALRMHVDEERHDGSARIAERQELAFVETRVGHSEAALRRQTRQLFAAKRSLVRDSWLPVAQQRCRRDVVIVHELRLGPCRQDVVDGTPDRGLIQQPAPTRGPPELDHRPPLLLDVRRETAVVDVRVDTRRAQAVTQVQRADADGVATGERRNDLVDSHGAAVYRRVGTPIVPMHQFVVVGP